MIHQHTMTQLKTVQDPMKLLSSTNVTANLAVSAELVTTTVPASSNGAVVVPAGSLNYLKIIPMVSSSSNTPTIRVTGWTKSEAGNYWVPQMLFFGTVTAITSSTAAIGSNAALYAATTITKTDGDAKIYNVTDNKTSAMLLIDTLGCQLIKIEFGNSTTAGTANAFIGAI